MTENAKQPSRRRFLQTLGAGAALYSLMPSCLFADTLQDKKPSFTKLAFVDQNGYGPQLDAPYVEEMFIPLHKEMALPAMDVSSAEYQNALAVLKSEFKAMNEDWSDDFHLAWSYQHYGAPDTSNNCRHLLHYCQSVQSYLYQSIQGLEGLNMSWRALDESMDVESEKGNYALAGKYTYFVLRVSAVDSDGIVQEPYLVNAQPVNRAIHYINASDGDIQNPDQRLIYVISGATSLVSPFSELIHMSTHNPAMRYASELKREYEKQKAKSLARSSGETVTESAAVLIALDYLHELGNDKRASQIVRHAQSLSNQLPEFSHSISYMQKYGVQTALKVYSESPHDYMKAIARMG